MPNTPVRKVCCILLAAGRGQRFGGTSNKLLLPLADGTPVILDAVRNIPCALRDVYVVVPPEYDSLAITLQHEGVQFVINTAAEQGMGSSLACGIAASVEADAWVIALADMPWIQPRTIKAVVEALENDASLAVPRYQGQRGHPVGFNQRFRAELLKLHGDQGARSVLERNQKHIHYIEVNDPGILLDVDTPADLTRAIAINR
jgi:molybdenum cofactor cytidylyltransferase